MKTSLLAAGALAGAAAAFPELSKGGPNLRQRQDPNPYIPRQGNGVRAPCPGMNTLANHGYINRDGMGISAQNVIDGFQAAFNMDASVTTPGATNAINLCTMLQGTPCQTFDLWMLDTTHQIEHDGSLTRSDRNQTWNVNGNNYDMNTTVLGQTTSAWGGATHVDVGLANSARLLRNQQQMAWDTPGWFIENDGGALTENAFYLSSMDDPTLNGANDPTKVQARVDWILHWWEQEELPTALGWVRPTQVINNDYIQSIANLVSAAPTEAPPAGAIILEPTAIATADKRDLAALLADPTESAKVQSAAAQATQAAGPKPTMVNAYVVELSPEQWREQTDSINSYLTKFNTALGNLLDIPLGGIL